MTDLIKTAEKIVYEVASWTVLVPKTFAAALRPSWGREYVDAQEALPEAERYAGYVSPMLYFLVVSVVPLTLSKGLRAAAFETSLVGSGAFEALGPDKQILATALLLVSVPMGAATVALLLRQGVTRATLARVLGYVLYPFTTAVLLQHVARWAAEGTGVDATLPTGLLSELYLFVAFYGLFRLARSRARAAALALASVVGGVLLGLGYLGLLSVGTQQLFGPPPPPVHRPVPSPAR